MPLWMIPWRWMWCNRPLNRKSATCGNDLHCIHAINSPAYKVYASIRNVNYNSIAVCHVCIVFLVRGLFLKLICGSP